MSLLLYNKYKSILFSCYLRIMHDVFKLDKYKLIIIILTQNANI